MIGCLAQKREREQAPGDELQWRKQRMTYRQVQVCNAWDKAQVKPGTMVGVTRRHFSHLRLPPEAGFCSSKNTMLMLE